MWPQQTTIDPIGMEDDLEATSDMELMEEPKQYSVKRRLSICAEPMMKGYFKEPFWNKNESWSIQLHSWLSNNALFAHNTRVEIAKLVRAMSTHLAMKDEEICKQGEKQDSLICVLQGSVNAYDEATKSIVGVRGVGSVIDATAVLWATKRPYRLIAAENNVILAKLVRENYTNLSIRFKYYQRGAHQEMVQNAKLLEMLNEEQIASLTDVLTPVNYNAGDMIIVFGTEGREMYFVEEGEARAWGEAEGGGETEYCRYHRGDLFGERALLRNAPRAANVQAVTKCRLLSLSRKQFDRILGPMDKILREQYEKDPRKVIADFYADGDSRGPFGNLRANKMKPETKHGKSAWFVVYRPTSRDAISKMLNGGGVGKGLNVKGKSSKQGCLSGFVPFCQVSDNKHKPMIEQSPPSARTKLYYKSKASRVEARQKLEIIHATTHLNMDNPSLDDLNDYAPDVYGLHVPEALVREAYIMRPDLSPVFGWETGRRSEPFSMDMNLHAIRGETGKEPEVVLYQWDDMDVMNPRGQLIAYAEKFVKPVVSDFDTFTVASQGMQYLPVPDDQATLMTWALEHTNQILQTPDHQAWTSRWIDVLRMENERGFHPTLPKYGFGDPTSYDMCGGVVKATEACGAVRHGAECFNYYFPQELDDEFLVVWLEFQHRFKQEKPWAYFTEPKLREFLLDRIKEGYAFPINPIWPVRDKGWKAVLDALSSSAEGQKVLQSWYPPHLQILETINSLQRQFPKCFVQIAAESREEQAKVVESNEVCINVPENMINSPREQEPKEKGKVRSKWCTIS
jgi:cAMP-dependent protein kinase regulator